jgi:hypothetical protein
MALPMTILKARLLKTEEAFLLEQAVRLKYIAPDKFYIEYKSNEYPMVRH